MFPLRNLAGSLAICMAMAATPAAAQDGLVAIDYESLNQAIIDGQIVPAHDAFVAATEALETTLGDFCDGSVDNLDAVIAAYHGAYDDWMALSWINFGPETLFMRPVRVHFWPDRRNALGRQLGELLNAPRDDLLDPATLGETSVALQGLPALERLLFEVEGLAAGSYACDLARSIAANLHAIGQDLARAWADPEERRLSLPSGQDLTNAMFQAVYEHFEMILFRKLAPALGNPRRRRGRGWRRTGAASARSTISRSTSGRCWASSRMATVWVSPMSCAARSVRGRWPIPW
ncbi:MAG: imelysin family protein [Azospirillaceae bacterium]